MIEPLLVLIPYLNSTFSVVSAWFLSLPPNVSWNICHSSASADLTRSVPASQCSRPCDAISLPKSLKDLPAAPNDIHETIVPRP